LNIVFVNRYFYPYLGGVEFYILNLAKELIKEGNSVTVVCLKGKKGTNVKSFFNGVRVVRVSNILGMFFYFFHQATQLHLCHVNMPRNWFSFFGLVFSKVFRIPTVFTPHCFYPSQEPLKSLAKTVCDLTLTKIMFKLSNKVINLTEKDKEDSIQKGMQEFQSVIIPNSVNKLELDGVEPYSFMKKYGLKKPFLLHIGRFAPVKCIDFLIQCHLHIPEGFDLILMGQDDGTLNSVSRLILEKKLKNRIHIIEKAPFVDVCSAYTEALALVISSFYEGLPTVILEAMFFQAPVVASSVGGIPFVIKDGENGFLYQWNDMGGYVECVKKVMVEGKKVAHTAKKNLIDNYLWERNAQKILKIYKELTKNGKLQN